MRKKLRELRQSKGISQKFIAQKLGYKYSSGYSNIEYGINRLSYEQALQLAEIFNVDVSELEEKNFEHKLHEKCKSA